MRNVLFEEEYVEVEIVMPIHPRELFGQGAPTIYIGPIKIFSMEAVYPDPPPDSESSGVLRPVKEWKAVLHINKNQYTETINGLNNSPLISTIDGKKTNHADAAEQGLLDVNGIERSYARSYMYWLMIALGGLLIAASIQLDLFLVGLAGCGLIMSAVEGCCL
jgi:hypothetical protein